MRSNICILVLAAGASTRMKKVKQLLSWKGKPLVEHVINNARRSKANTVFLVLGAHRELIEEALIEIHPKIIINKNWESGMGSSIASGVSEILKHSTPDGILLLLADQPLIDTEYINKMIDSFSNSKMDVIGTAYNSKTGVPAIFDKSLFPNLVELKGREGAWKVISKYSENTLALDAGEKIVDMDTEEDYNYMSSNH